MCKIISLRDACRSLACRIRDVESGEEYVITRNGRPVARLVPIAEKRILTPQQLAARARARARMENGWPVGAGRLDRDALYEP